MKKKHIILILLLCNVQLSFSQSKETIQLDWKETFFSIDDVQIKVPGFDSDNLEYDGVASKIYFKKVFLDVNFNELELVNFQTETISESSLFDLKKQSLETGINFISSSTLARNQRLVSLSFNPIYIDKGVLKRVISIEINKINNFNKISSNYSTQNIVNSVLTSGDFYRFSVEKSGVYRLSKSFLESIGFNTNTDPRTIKIYGNGGRMIPLLNSIPHPSDLEENSIEFVGEEDGRFDSQDYILFYAEGVDVWNSESQTHVNLFEEKAYYFVTSSSGNGKRIQQATQPTSNPSTTFTLFDDYTFYEKDLFNLGKLGRKWVGEEFNIETTMDFDFDIPNLNTSFPVNVYINLVSASQGNAFFKVKVNNQNLSNVNFLSLSAVQYVSGVENIVNQDINVAGSAIKVSLDYDKNGVPSSKGYLDYIAIRSKRNLVGYNKQFLFKNEAQQNNIGVGQYSITSASNISRVWDVTDIYNVSSYLNDSQSTFNFKVNLGTERKYVAVDLNDTFTPSRVTNSKVVNQNLKGTIFLNNQGAFQDIDYLIITPKFLLNQAEKLAQFHRNYFSYNVKVVTLEKIYLEFGSGRQDIAAIRNFIKYVYQNASTDSKRVQFVNLFGDASFDYKNRIPNNTNVVPVFHGLNPNQSPVNNFTNFSLINTFMADDFFALLDDNEGNMVGAFDGLDVAVGRMLVNNTMQADEMVEKVIGYYDVESYGRWRNNYAILTDDAQNYTDVGLQFDLNNLIDDLNDANQFINVQKIHTDAYIQEVSAGGDRYPKAASDFIDAFEKGALVLNYYGHGGENGFASERLFEINSAINLNNKFNLPLLVTMTCDFTRFDNPFKETGGEYTYWNKNGGAIALISTTRPIFIPVALSMNNVFNTFLYQPQNNVQLTIGEALRRAKILNTNPNRRVVSCIGDPALMLAIPKPKVVLTKINNVPVLQNTEVLNALSYATLAGEITDNNGNLLSNYNGDLAVQIFDKEINRVTLGNDGLTGQNPGGSTYAGNFYPANTLIQMPFKTLGETIFRGNASVVNGKFEFGFVVPRDIKIPIGTGKVSFYAKANQPNLQDQTGYDFSVNIGGINLNAPEDNIPPTVKLYMNDTNFVYGGITNESPFFLAYLEDQNGMNTASGIGHDMIAILDGNELEPYILNDYYETENDNYQKGLIKFPFRNLSPGLHTITFKAWDVYNNLVTAEIQFIVVGDENIKLENVLNYPNPFVSYTEFWFNHNRPNELLNVQVQILTVTGKIVKTINQSIETEGFLSRTIKWDGRDDFGDKIGKGVYVYKLTVQSTVDNKKVEKYEKLVLL